MVKVNNKYNKKTRPNLWNRGNRYGVATGDKMSHHTCNHVTHIKNTAVLPLPVLFPTGTWDLVKFRFCSLIPRLPHPHLCATSPVVCVCVSDQNSLFSMTGYWIQVTPLPVVIQTHGLRVVVEIRQ